MHSLPPLPYAYDALEPHLDELTVRLHHDAHHKAYVDGLNNAEAKLIEARESGDFGLVKHWKRELAFHGAGHQLHTLFWENMRPDGGGPPHGAIAAQIEADFGGFGLFRKYFSTAATVVEGSGWGLLCWNRGFGRLEVLTVEKHQNLALWDTVPLLACDVWEHAYYLKYQNKRVAWVEAWWNLVNWDDVSRRLKSAGG